MPGPSDHSRAHLPSIYVHAGAGYHSHHNEKVHLHACADAARAAMALLRVGASATDAVEMAISILENNEVTNAGFGSNMTLEGLVECDATIVDHLGRSGAVGAMGRILNPIKVARVVLEQSCKPMLLKRVPPNLLVGKGATRFAHDHGIAVIPNAGLVSESARDRHVKWKRDLDIAERRDLKSSMNHQVQVSPVEMEEIDKAMKFGPALSSDPAIAALANESQSFSPGISEDQPSDPMSEASVPPELAPRSPHSAPSLRSNNGVNAADVTVDSISDDTAIPTKIDAAMPAETRFVPAMRQCQDQWQNPHGTIGLVTGAERPVAARPQFVPEGWTFLRPTDGNNEVSPTETVEEADNIVDTVGAIAVDCLGRIAAGSSSGGIGMKHSGRTGPAALVGVGTAVIPIDPSDKEQTTAACVLSGTGEHMATTMAAQTCANRIYSCTKAGPRGEAVPCSEDEAMLSFVSNDFMNHPSVKTSYSLGAIGALVVKKNRDGMWLHFAHNTDSFAIATMHADDIEPHTVMSRNKKPGKITSGARAMRRVVKPSSAPSAKRRKHRHKHVNGMSAPASATQEQVASGSEDKDKMSLDP